MNFDTGRFEWHYDTVIDDETGETVPHIADVTADVRRMYRENGELKRKNESLSKEIHDIKTRRYWEEVNVYTDDRTGRLVVVKTVYQYEPKTMRLEVTPEMLDSRYF